jgi:hypothetical protein
MLPDPLTDHLGPVVVTNSEYEDLKKALEKYLGETPEKDPDYPQVCPKCKGPAYQGIGPIDCKNKCGS